MAFRIPSKRDIEVQALSRHTDSSDEILEVLDYDCFVDFNRDKLIIRVIVAPPVLHKKAKL